MSREDAMPQAPSLGGARMDSFVPKPAMMVRTIDTVIELRKSTHPHDLCFSITKAAVGAVIGKGGQNLKDMQTDFGVRVFVEKEDFSGKRLVVLTYTGQGPADTEAVGPEVAEDALRRCQAHIEDIVQDLLNRQTQAEAIAVEAPIMLDPMCSNGM